MLWESPLEQGNRTVETELVYIELAIVHYKSNKTKAKLQHKT